MTKTLTKHLQAIKDSKRGIFVPYIMAGDHAKGLDGLFETITLLENSGVSAIEVGIPWSDPVAAWKGWGPGCSFSSPDDGLQRQRPVEPVQESVHTAAQASQRARPVPVWDMGKIEPC